MKNPEMLEALSALAIEKGISEEIMLEALANALVTAYKRMPEAAEEALVEIDVETGEIRVIAQELDEEGNVTREWDDTPADFGRIAAQTAKQVILQRIREAEREMKYEEYAGREGDIVTGIIQQTDARYTLLDLGRVEALLPQAEQVPGDRYDHGARMKAYIVEVRKTAKGPQIVVSRTHPGLVRRLFELEVPELRRRCGRDPGRRPRARSPHQARGRVERPERRPGRRVRRCARHARAPGRERAARREGRHRSLQRRRARVRDARARTGEGARGAASTRTPASPRSSSPTSSCRSRSARKARTRASRRGSPAGASTSRARRSSRRKSRASGYAEGEWVEGPDGTLMWQPAEGGEAISAAEAGLRDARRRTRRRRRSRRRRAAPAARRPTTATAAEPAPTARRRGTQPTEEPPQRPTSRGRPDDRAGAAARRRSTEES